MNAYYPDLMGLSDAVPMWWDENGVPRFSPFHPSLCPDIYADIVVLVETHCQACHRAFPVQMSWRRMDQVVYRFPSEEFSIEQVPHYGDPPNHQECPAGNTMNVEDSSYLQFWIRGKNTDKERWIQVL
jgi:hypothetical protein